MRRAFVAALCAATLLAGCGGGGKDSTLDKAEHAMASLERGSITLRLTAKTPKTGPVGFAMDGRYWLRHGKDLPVLDFTYEQLLGTQASATSRIVSTGTDMFVRSGDTVTEVPPAQRQQLALGDGSGGVSDLGIAGWVRDPKEQTAGGVTTVTGRVDVPDLLGDLSRILAQAGGGGDPGAVTGKQADALQSLVQSSAIAIRVDGDDDLPQKLTARIDFGGSVPKELVRALGRYAATTLDLTLTLSKVGAFTVQRPS